MKEGPTSPPSPPFLVLSFKKKDTAAAGSRELAASLPLAPSQPRLLHQLSSSSSSPPGCRRSAVFLLGACGASGWAAASSLALPRADQAAPGLCAGGAGRGWRGWGWWALG